MKRTILTAISLGLAGCLIAAGCSKKKEIVPQEKPPVVQQMSIIKDPGDSNDDAGD